MLHPLSVVQSCPAPSGLWIALLSGGSPVSYRRFTYQMASQACYARARGYSYLLDHTTRVDPEEARKHQLPVFWVKYCIIRRWLQYFDWIFWADLDVTIFGLEKPLESFFEMAPQAHLVLPRDAVANFVFSADALLLRNSPWGQTFLARWWANRLTCPAWDDQGPLWMAVAANASEHNQTACTPFCFGKRPHTQLYECVDRRFREVAVEGAPIYFPPLDFEKGLPGLCLNGFWNNHKQYPALQRELPWCLHTKTPKAWAGPELRRRVRWDTYQCPVLDRKPDA
eukprot:EG_transcript_18969